MADSPPSSTEEKKGGLTTATRVDTLESPVAEEGPINASGHVQELHRNFGLLSIVGLAITSGNVWIALGGTIVIAIGSGGPPGVIYEFIAASVFYWFIAASIAELASSVPSSGGIYHWATITGGRAAGFWAGWLNFLGFMFGTAATYQIAGTMLMSMYALFHPGFVVERWHVFVTYLVMALICALVVIYANKILPTIEALGGFLVIVGSILTVIVCLALSKKNKTDFVWKDWQNLTGYKSDGFVFCLGMLNGAFAVGVADIVSHMAEEVPHPSATLPKGIFYEYLIGFTTGLAYLVTIIYSIQDFDKVFESSTIMSFPLAEIYRQATGTRAGAFGLLLLAFLPWFISSIGCLLNASRIIWTLARDNATPFHNWVGRINHRTENPANAIIACSLGCVALGFIYFGSNTAFAAFVGSYVVLSSLSYLLAILPNLLKGRSMLNPGWFYMKGASGFVVNGISCSYIVAFVVIFCFPATSTVSAATMNYTSLMAGGVSLAVLPLWLWKQSVYKGPILIAHSRVTAKDAL